MFGIMVNLVESQGATMILAKTTLQSLNKVNIMMTLWFCHTHRDSEHVLNYFQIATDNNNSKAEDTSYENKIDFVNII